MSDIYRIKPRPITAAIMCLGFGLAIQGNDLQAGYLTNSYGEVVMTGGQECWNIGGGLEGPVEACGDVIEVAAVEELDSDGDGVPDGQDECPDTPQGVEVDANGCPKDSDGDGVPDYLDKCPGTPSGSKVDANGCQIIEDLVLKVTTDHFKFDSASLEPAMIKALDGVLGQINASTGDENLQIIGHTDSTGPDSYNQGLSERRAQSVANYLIQNGFPKTKLTVSGMGEKQPVADNSTREGRTMNRRVEILTH